MEKKIILEGEMIHHVGYRPFLLTEALKLKKITNFEAENILEYGKQKVIIYMVGEEQKVLEFVEFIKNNCPEYTRNCKVISEEDKCIGEVMPIHDFRIVLSVEQQNNIVQGGLLISNKIDNLRKETGQNFKRMDEKYDAISKAMFKIAEKIEERNKTFEERIEKTESLFESRIERTDKNIETLLNILINKK